MWLKQIRDSAGLSQTQVANSVKMSQQYYSFIESGERRPSVETAKKIAKILGFDWTIFFENDSDKTA